MSGSAAFYRAANLIIMDYPYEAAIASGLRVCDEACIVVGQSVDGTRDAIYALQDRYGRDRLKIREETFRFDRGWQERWWNWSREMTTADWHMYHDADEALHEEYAPKLRKIMRDPKIQVIIFPYIHLYGTAGYRVLKGFYDHNSRLGRASAGYRMRNWCSDEHPKWAACQMVIRRNGREVDAHNVHDDGAVWVDTPMLHYGWCRTPQALAISQTKHTAWYADGAGLQDGRVPQVEPYDYRMAERLIGGMIEPYKGPHPADMGPWLRNHAEGWAEIDPEKERTRA